MTELVFGAVSVGSGAVAQPSFYATQLITLLCRPTVSKVRFAALIWPLLLHTLPSRLHRLTPLLVPTGQQAADPAAQQHHSCRGGHHRCPLRHAAAQPAPPQAAAAEAWRAAARPSCGSAAGLGSAQPSRRRPCQQRRAQPPAGLWPEPGWQRRAASRHPQPLAGVCR